MSTPAHSAVSCAPFPEEVEAAHAGVTFMEDGRGATRVGCARPSSFRNAVVITAGGWNWLS